MTDQLDFQLDDATTARPERAFYPGLVCKITSVHHPVFTDQVGERVVIVRTTDGMAWVHDDKPVTYRVNRNGNRVVDRDPRSILSSYSFDRLEPMPGLTPQFNW